MKLLGREEFEFYVGRPKHTGRYLCSDQWGLLFIAVFKSKWGHWLENDIRIDKDEIFAWAKLDEFKMIDDARGIRGV